MNGAGHAERAAYAQAFSRGYSDAEYDAEWHIAATHDHEAALLADVRIFRECGSGRATRVDALGEARGYRAGLADARTEPKRTVLP